MLLSFSGESRSAWRENRIEILGRSLAADVKRLIANPPDHVQIHHRDDFIQRDRRMLDEIFGPDQSLFLGSEADEENRPRRRRAVRQARRQFQYAGGPRSVVVRAVIDAARRTEHVAQHPQAQVIVMSADHDKLIGVRPGARKNGGDVLQVSRQRD